MTDNKLATITKEISPIEKEITTLQIVDTTTLTQAIEYLSQVNRYLDNVVADREKITKPINQSLREIRLKYKPTESALETLVSILRDKMSKYQTNLANEAKKAQEKIAKRIGEGSGHYKLETALSKLDAITKPEEEIITATGSAKFRAVQVLVVDSLAKIPDLYFDLNEKRLLEDMKGGKQIDGAHLDTIQSPINYRS